MKLRRAELTLFFTAGLLLLAACGGGAPGPVATTPGVDAGPQDVGVAAPGDAAAEDVAAAEDAAPAEDAFVEPDLPEYSYDGELGPDDLFQRGVASGDPLTDRVILWTHLSLPTGAEEVEVYYELALDPAFARRVAAGFGAAPAARDHTVKIDAAGLGAGTTYYYRFTALGRTSPIGRTRTAAAPDVALDAVRFGVVSCSNYNAGYFHAYRELAARPDLDAVIHLGDYIYEYAGGAGVRPADPPRELTTLADYRLRYAQARQDPSLREAHRQHPWIVVWDDHETANNSWRGGAQNHNEGEGAWEDRRDAAWQAWAEWMPVREQAPMQLWRSLRFGDLVDLILLDTRIWGRDEQVSAREAADRPERQLLGADQEAWLDATLRDASARWQVLGQQVMMSHLLVGDAPLNTDQWDGYPGARERLFQMLEDHQRSSTLVLTGDIHTSWASELARDPQQRPYAALAVEFVTPGVTSAGFPEALAGAVDSILLENPHLRWAELTQRGYIVLTVMPERAQAAWFHYSDVTSPEASSTFAAAWSVQPGIPVLRRERVPEPPAASAPSLAP